MDIWGVFHWALDLDRIEPRPKYAWLVIPLSFLILIAAMAVFFLVWPLFSFWELVAVGFVLTLVSLVAEYFLVSWLLPARIRRAR